ncbi:MAG: hypothetical protein ACFCU1_06080 [Sumerlaeia bacterium]
MSSSKIFRLSLLGLVLLSGLFAGCNGSGNDQVELASVVDPNQNGRATAVLGYNRPTEFQKGIGLRAASSGNQLVISVLNNSADQIILGPKSFRVLLPNEMVPLDEGNLDLTFFPVRTINPGENTIFSVIIPRFDSMTSYKLVMNYPPKQILLPVAIESASNNTTIILQEPDSATP